MKVMFLCEAVTLAHVGRTMSLAEGLQRRGVEVQLALCGSTGDWTSGMVVHAIPGIGAAAFAAALRAGRPVLDVEVLRRSVADDLRLLELTKPDLVIGDFRLSLSVSARLAKVPYATLTNAYWCPECALPTPMPVLPLSKALPLPLASLLFHLGKHVVMGLHAMPMNRVRLEYGLPSLGRELRRVYADADHVLLADVPGMFPFRQEPINHHFLGAVLWAPPTSRPTWWERLTPERPLVYITVGSSGDPTVLRRIVQALRPLGLQLAVATAGSDALDDLAGDDLFLARYLPGDELAARADMVICNGGSMGCQQALAADRPVLGVCGNMDQFLNMEGVTSAGAGLSMRADRIRAASVQASVRALLDQRRFRLAASALGKRIRSLDAVERLHALLPSLIAA